MSCNDFSFEMYDLHALGVLQGAESDAIDEHLRNGCSTCQDEFRLSLERASLIALAVPEVAPRRALRGRVVASVRPTRTGFGAWLQSPAWTWSAAALCVAAASGASWYYGARSVAPAEPVIVSRVSPPVVLPAAPQQTVAAPVPASQPMVTADDSRELNRARAEAAALSQNVVEQRTRIGQLESQVQSKDAELASVAKERGALQIQLAKASQNDGSRVQELQAQLSANQRQVDELTRQVHFYRTAIQSQRGDLEQSVRLISLLSAPALRVLDLQGTEQGAGASGRALLANNNTLIFYGSGLPSLPAGRTYQLWLMKDRGRAVTSGGIFQPDASRAAILTVDHAQGVADVRALAVTEEPAGGVPLPTGHKILIGTAKS